MGLCKRMETGKKTLHLREQLIEHMLPEETVITDDARIGWGHTVKPFLGVDSSVQLPLLR